MKNKNEWMRSEIASWRDDGIIEGGLAETLLARYPVSQSKLSLGAVLAGSFGALLIGLGIIALFAANWDCFNRAWRAAISVAPMVFCGMLALLASVKHWKARAFWEPLGILWSVAIIAAACLVAQTYQVGGNIPGFVFFVALLVLPVVWFTQSVAMMSVWPVFAIVWSGCANEAEGESWGLVFKSLGLLALSLPAYLAFLRRKPSGFALGLGQFSTGLFYSAGAAMLFLASAPRDFVSVESGILIFWAFSAVVLLAGVFFKLPFWVFIAVFSAANAAIASIGGGLPLYVVSLLLAIAVTAFGVYKVSQSYTNVGAGLFLVLIVAKFFESKLDFTVKGLILIASGVVLTVLNIAMAKIKKRRMAA